MVGEAEKVSELKGSLYGVLLLEHIDAGKKQVNQFLLRMIFRKRRESWRIKKTETSRYDLSRLPNVPCMTLYEQGSGDMTTEQKHDGQERERLDHTYPIVIQRFTD